MSVSQQISSPHSLRVLSLLEQAELWSAEGQIERSRASYAQATRLNVGCFARLRFGEFLYQSGHVSEAIAEFSQALEIARRQQNHHGRAVACHHLAVLHRERGESAVAKSFQQQEIAARLLDQAQHPADFPPPADFLALANDALLRGDLDYAEQLAEQGLKFAQSQNCLGDLADAWGTWGGLQFLKSHDASAWRGFLKAYALHCRANDEEGRVADLLNLAQVSRQQGWWPLTKRLLLKAGKIIHRTGLVHLLQKTEAFLEEANRVLAVADRTPEWN